MEQGALSFGGSWTVEKLAILGKYLRAYTNALKRQPFELIYIDAFAGTGYCGKEDTIIDNQQLEFFPELKEEDTQAYITGSARIALQTNPPFQRYIYIDIDPKNCAKLDQLKEEYPDKASIIEIINADANDYIQQFIRTTSWRYKRAVMFLDPYGMEVRWDTVCAIAKSQAIDMWYLFPVSAVNRMLTKTGDIYESWVARLNTLLGSEDWINQFYDVYQDVNLFENQERPVKNATWNGIMQYIVKRLESEFAGVAKEPRFLKNKRTNTTLFLMCFAAANPGRPAELAVKIAQDILNGMEK